MLWRSEWKNNSRVAEKKSMGSSWVRIMTTIQWGCCITFYHISSNLSNLIKEHLEKLDESVSRRWNSPWKELRLGFTFFLSLFKVFGRINMEDVPLKNEWQRYGKISYINIWKFWEVVLVSSKTLVSMFWIKSRLVS